MTIVAVAILFAVITYFAVQNSIHTQQANSRKAEQKEGLVISEEKDVKTDIKVGPDGKIINGSDINISDDMKTAIEIETNGSNNAKISIDGIDAQGGLNIDGGYAKFFDHNGVSHTVKLDENTVIMYGDKPLSKDIINTMDNISYSSDGGVIIDHMNVVGKYDNNGDMTFLYNGPDGVSYGSTYVKNVSERNGIFYSNGERVNDIQQEYMTKFDKILDDKYPSTANDNFFLKYKEPVVDLNNNKSERNNDKNNLNASTNLEIHNNSIQI